MAAYRQVVHGRCKVVGCQVEGQRSLVEQDKAIVDLRAVDRQVEDGIRYGLAAAGLLLGCRLVGGAVLIEDEMEDRMFNLQQAQAHLLAQ